MAVLARLTGLQRMIRAWRTDQPTELASQLEEHQREVDEALRRVGAGAWPRLAERAVAGGTHTAKLGELLLVETTTRDAELKLPEVTGDVLGSVCGVAKLQTTNEVRVSVPRGRIDGSTGALTLAAVGMRLFVATTKGWWSVGGDAEGEYAPSVTAVAGVSSPTVQFARYQIVGRSVRLDVTVDVTFESGSQKELRIGLPFARGADFSGSNEGVGVGVYATSSAEGVARGNTVNGTELLTFVGTHAATSGSGALRGTITYRLP